jgi:hypothetical protein
MTPLKWIVNEAKKLKKQYPHRFKKWTDYVAQASAIYASKHKGKSPVGKKRKVSGVTKKAAKKKVIKKSVLRKKAVKKSPARMLHKDTNSHNVKISVMSGIGAIKSAGLTHLKNKYGILSSKKLMEKTKRGKNKIAKEMREIATKIKKLNSI